jgi:hypothetical protein
MLVWVNSHGTFLIGLVLIGIWIGQIIWDVIKSRNTDEYSNVKKSVVRPSIILGITTLACLVNPRGLGIINYLKTLTSNNVVQNLVTEWAPPSLDSLMGVIFLSGLMASAIILAISPKRPSFTHLSSFLIFGLLGLKTSRGSVWFGLVMAPILAEHLALIVNQLQKNHRQSKNFEGSLYLNVIISLLIIFMGVFSLPWFKSALPFPQAKAGLISTETPIEATQVLLEQLPAGQLFNSMSFGSYLIWAAHPQYQVFVDSRIELFPEKVWMDYLNISNANGNWESLLGEYGVNTLVLSPVEQPALINAVPLSGQWQMIYQDAVATIFIRNSSPQ